MTIVLSRDQQKLAKLLEIEGFGSMEEMAEAVFSDSVSPGICVNEGCTYTTEVEPDQDRGWCDECSSYTVKSAPILAGLI